MHQITRDKNLEFSHKDLATSISYILPITCTKLQAFLLRLGIISIEKFKNFSASLLQTSEIHLICSCYQGDSIFNIKYFFH